MNSFVEEYLTAEKAAAILDVTPQMIRKLCHGGHLPFYKVGRCIRVSRADFDKYLAWIFHEFNLILMARWPYLL